MDDSDEAKRRQAILGKFARTFMKADSERDRLKCVDEVNENGENTIWLSRQAQARKDERQLDYARPYILEFHDEPPDPKKPNPSDEKVEQNANLNLSRLRIQDDQPNPANQTPNRSELAENIPNIRARSRRGRVLNYALAATSQSREVAESVCSSRQSVVEFERVSTILPPSDIGNAGDDYTSNVSVKEIRKDYFSNYKTTTNLPIYPYRSNLINSINSYSVIIIQGQTGCGKTTQVPMYIMEDAILEKSQDRAPVIYVTQPRRIAARSIATRVCEEHNWQLGSLVGYQVGLEKCVGPQTILTYCTSGVLLQKLIQEKSLKNYTHIIIDEAHERDADTDLLMMMIRTLMRKEMSFFRLIVMSATIDITKLKSYFTFKTNYGHNSQTTPSICRIGNQATNNDLQIIYFEKLKSSFQIQEPIPNFDYSEPDIHEECLNAAVKIIVDLIPHLDTYSTNSQTALVFLPGLAEITKLHKMLAAKRAPLDIIPLHSCISTQDQARVFFPTQRGYRKVILATNIAESSITVKDAGFIIDFCLTKTLRKDEVTRFPTLKLDWCSQDKSIQRAGRTGRCCPGKVFRLVTMNFYKGFRDFAEPELLTAPLELSVLRVKNFDMGEIKALLAVVLDPPPFEEIRTAVLELKQIGALSSTYQGSLSDIDGDLTQLGKIICNLPIDVHLSKLIVIAHLLDVLEDAIIVAACLSTNRTVVKHLYGKMLESYDQKLEWARGSNSDLFVSLDVYKEYMYYKDELKKDQRFLENYCNNRHLDERKLHDVSALEEELRVRLSSLNIIVKDQPNRSRNLFEDELMLKIAFCAAFYPNYFLSTDFDPSEVQRDLYGFDPTKTVVLHNFPPGQTVLYRNQVITQFKQRIPGDLDYIADNSRALLVINDDSVIKVPDYTPLGMEKVVRKTVAIKKSVYLALKCNELDQISIREYQEGAAFNRVKYYKDARNSLRSDRLAPSLTKIVTDRPVDNRGLTETNDEEYIEYFKKNYFVEVELNQEQEKLDTIYLRELIKEEESRKESDKEEECTEPKVDTIFKGFRYLRGPTSPIQMKFRSVLEKSKGYNVEIDCLSVNSILLDPEYEIPKRQMLVAASVAQTYRQNRLMARDTTLMPNIRGLPTIMALLFGQYSRLIYNDALDCFSGAIFGLGWDEEDRPLSRQYEVEINFDVHVTDNDIELINSARKITSDLLKFVEVQNPGAPQASLQQKLRQVMIALIRKRRHPMEPISISEIDWNEQDCNFIMDKKNSGTENGIEFCGSKKIREFLPIMQLNHSINELDYFKKVRANLNRLDDIEQFREPIPRGGVQCLLCGSGLKHWLIMQHAVANHLNSDGHIRNLEQFEKSEERARLRAEATEDI